MMNNVVNVHTYLTMNAVLIVSYMLIKALIKVAPKKMSAQSLLRLVRWCFVMTILLCLGMPLILAYLPTQNDPFILTPLLHHTTNFIMDTNEIIINNDSAKKISILSISFKEILFFCWSIGCSFYTYHYLKTILQLKQLRQQAFSYHLLFNVQLLISHQIDTPLCWSGLRRHYVILPHALLEKTTDFRLALRHELQHLRQGDTLWMHFMVIMQLLCFWNPFVILWRKWFTELQEFACDEAIIVNKKTSPVLYAACLMNTATSTFASQWAAHGVLGVNNISPSILYRRINMLFNYRQRTKKWLLASLYCLGFLGITSTTYALNNDNLTSLSTQEVTAIIQKTHADKTFAISATPEIVAEINKIRGNKEARVQMREALKRMKMYQTLIENEFQQNQIPHDFLALPLLESGYQPLEAKKNPLQAAGIWQIIPSTAVQLGLKVNNKQDDRFDILLATQAAIRYLKSMQNMYHDWNLSMLSYEIGDKEVTRVMKETGSNDVWTLAKSPTIHPSIKDFVAMFAARVIILNDPSLVDERG